MRKTKNPLPKMTQKMPDKKELVIFAAFLAVLIFQFARETATSIKESLLLGSPSAKVAKTMKVNYFDGIEIAAKAAIVWDAKENKVLFAKNERVQLPLASLAKIMTALLALENSGGEGNAVLISKEAVAEEGDNGLIVGEHWQTDDLTKLTLVSSSNDGARALAMAFAATDKEDVGEISFVQLMNARAKRLGLSETYFLNETGLDLSSSSSGSYGSAEDIAKLFHYAVLSYPETFGATNKQELSVWSSSYSGEIVHKVKNTNKAVEEMPGVIASKTGFTDLAGGNLVVMASLGLNHPIVAVVLGSTEEGRFSDISKLLWATTETLGN